MTKGLIYIKTYSENLYARLEIVAPDGYGQNLFVKFVLDSTVRYPGMYEGFHVVVERDEMNNFRDEGLLTEFMRSSTLGLKIPALNKDRACHILRAMHSNKRGHLRRGYRG